MSEIKTPIRFDGVNYYDADGKMLSLQDEETVAAAYNLVAEMSDAYESGGCEPSCTGNCIYCMAHRIVKGGAT